MATIVMSLIMLWVFVVTALFMVAYFMIVSWDTKNKEYDTLCTQCRQMHKATYRKIRSNPMSRVTSGFVDNSIVDQNGKPYGRHSSFVFFCPTCNKDTRQDVLAKTSLSGKGIAGIFIAMGGWLILNAAGILVITIIGLVLPAII